MRRTATMALSSVIRRGLSPRLASPWRSFHEGPDTIDELLDRHLVKKSPKDNDEDDELAAQRRLTGTRREALSLYRDVLRASRFFAWPDARGVPWREVLRENARREFEEARFERDPEVVTRLLIGGRDAVQKALDKLVEGSKKRVEAEEQQRRDGGGR
ncbi:Complex 1 protein (LYR family) [Musa troglodytarum]|uniref:Complex 1 protein (LYR family) n=1 Tax=Musa troglodytarum TaxID=320322 RepID=A0A9E7G4I8_9LILI|nr:Complex 1 protein (LYR family) [Musa troglodytarum]URE04938.1 Complex 1 protein (LYR family) [Musa troglodytarum]